MAFWGYDNEVTRVICLVTSQLFGFCYFLVHRMKSELLDVTFIPKTHHKTLHRLSSAYSASSAALAPPHTCRPAPSLVGPGTKFQMEVQIPHVWILDSKYLRVINQGTKLLNKNIFSSPLKNHLGTQV